MSDVRWTRALRARSRLIFGDPGSHGLESGCRPETIGWLVASLGPSGMWCACACECVSLSV
eukprot:1482918-Prymnesium_polylepis.3